MKKKLRSLFTAAAVGISMIFTTAAPFGGQSERFSASAASADYPVQLMNISVKDNSKALTENGTSDGSSVSVKALGGDLSPSWRFDRVGSDANGTFFKICNAQSGRLLTPKGYSAADESDVIVYGDESDKSQHWYAVPVQTDRLKNNLYYKIVNYSNTALALTQGKSGMTLAKYTGADNQLWLLNADGLQGFAGYCSNDNTNNVKAGNIGGLFGETVEVSNFNDLKKYATSDTPYTIVVTKNIKVTELNMNGERYMCSAGRIYVRSNKTIIGSYGANTLFNVQFCTSSGQGVGNNVIIKNFDMQHDAESNNNDSIVCYFGSGQNIWVDHVTFTGHENYGYAPQTKQVDEDKFLACCYDADYCTVSDCSFGKHKYGLILGYPADDAGNKAKYGGYPRMSLISNKFDGCSTRAPGLMRWGYFHSLNNYVNSFSMAYTVMSDVNIYAENCVYENGGNVICDWDKAAYIGHYSESGSTFSGCKRTKQGGDSNSTADACSWRPSGNYNYVKLTAAQVKAYCGSYGGRQTSKDNVTYLRYSKSGVPSAGYVEAPSGPVAASFANYSTYRIKNVNSGLYMQVEGAKAENSANVQQWGTSENTVHDIWKLIDAGDGYYYIASAVGDGGTYMLDIYGKRTADGTNVDIYQYKGEANQQFMFTKNADGSYKIRTKITDGKSAIEIADGSTLSGANVQQWTINGASCQDWILELVSNPGCAMDTSVIYEFENVNSGMVMDIAGGKMESGSNVQQWSSNGYDCQRWTLQPFAQGGNYYYIRSVSDPSYVLKADGSANGGNIGIEKYNSKDSSMLFKFSKNPDGTYHIMTRASKDACLVETEAASQNSGANVQQWEYTGSDCQKWSAAKFTTTAPKPVTTITTTTVKPETTPPKPQTTAPKPETTESVETKPQKPTDKDEIVPGDVNADGKVSVADIVMIQKYLVKSENITGKQLIAADVNKDKTVNVFDAVLIRRMVLNTLNNNGGSQ